MVKCPQRQYRGLRRMEEQQMLTITQEQARQFILLKQGLLGEHRFAGKAGAYRPDAFSMIRWTSAAGTPS